MKSLEIVNERIENLEEKLKSAYELANGNPSSFGKQLIDCYEKYLDNCKQIKQDLEVLEIIRKKQVNISYLKQYFDDKIFTLKDIHYLTTLNNMYLTMEELLKLKQWLEENENGKEEN